MRLFDTHCHLDHDFDLPLDSLLAEARGAGVAAILLPAVEPSTWARSAEVAAQIPEAHLALGIHPQAVASLDERALDEALHALPDWLGRTGAVAVGEVGLDHAWDRDPAKRARQRRVFEAQLDIAHSVGLPVVIHAVRAHGTVLDLWAAHPCRAQVPGVMHAYSGSAEMVPRFVQENMYLSISGAVTIPTARRAPAACRVIPADRLLIETDAPYQPPHPLEGRPNRPARLVRVAEAVAALRGVSLGEIAETTYTNAARLFGAPG